MVIENKLTNKYGLKNSFFLTSGTNAAFETFKVEYFDEFLLKPADVENDAFTEEASVNVFIWVRNLNTAGVSFLKGSVGLNMLLLTILILDDWFIFLE